MAQLIYDKTGRLLFTKEMRRNIPFWHLRCFRTTLPCWKVSFKRQAIG